MSARAIVALGEVHHSEGDTVEVAAARSGLDIETLSRVVEHVGGEGSPTRFAQMTDADGDGSPLEEPGLIAKGLFGRY